MIRLLIKAGAPRGGKYYKREARPGGKWRYYYSKAEYDKEKGGAAKPTTEGAPKKGKPKAGDVTKLQGQPHMALGENTFAPVTKQGNKWVLSGKKAVKLIKKGGKIKTKTVNVSSHHVMLAQHKKESRESPEGGKFQEAVAKQRKEIAAKEHGGSFKDKKPQEGHFARVKRGTLARGIIGKVEKIKEGLAYLRTQLGELRAVPVSSLEFAKSLKSETEQFIELGRRKRHESGKAD